MENRLPGARQWWEPISQPPVNRLHIIAAFVVLACWTGAYIYSLVSHDYGLLDRITPIMVILAGYLFGDQLLRKRSGEEKV